MPRFHSSFAKRRALTITGILLITTIVSACLYTASRVHNARNKPAQQDALTQQAQDRPTYETFDFDPNTADSAQLLRLGLPSHTVRSIYKYRAMGGVYSEPADFTRVPGLTNETWERLSPHIRIDRRFQKVKPAPYHTPKQHGNRHTSTPPTPSEHRDTARYTQKLCKGETVELNTSDTAQLNKIPGIGSYYARQIVRYRQQLGGFVSLSQVLEIDGVPSDIEQYLTLNNEEIRKIDINNATRNELLRHPYIDSYRAQSIWEYRHNRGQLKGIEELRELMYFSEDDIQRLAPYLDFK